MIKDICAVITAFGLAVNVTRSAMLIVALVSQAIVAQGADTPRAWWNPSKIVQIETVIEKEVPVEKLVTVEKVVKVPTDRVTTVVWNETFLETEPIAATPTGPLRWLIETNPACSVCGSNWSDAKKELSPGGWSFGGAGNHFQREEVRFDHPIPVWKLMLGDKEIERHVGYVSPSLLRERYLREFEIANAPQGPAKTIDAGTITKEEVERYRNLFVRWFGLEGSVVVPNLKRREPWKEVIIDVPANVGFAWKIGDDGGITLNFNADTRPVGRWGIFSQSVSSMIYDTSVGEVRFVTPMARFSPVLKVVE